MKKIAVITGGSSGLGLSIAKLLYQKDISVCLIGRNRQRLQDAKEEIGHLVGKGEILTTDFSIDDEWKVQTFFETMELDGYEITHLFNVAGVGRFGPVDEITRVMIEEVLSANLVGMMLMTSNYLRNVSKGLIVNVMSTAARVGKVNEAVYCASKWGARGFTEALQVAYKNSPVKVMGVYPGGMKTPFWSEQQDTETYLNPDHVAKQIVEAACQKDVYVRDLVIERL